MEIVGDLLEQEGTDRQSFWRLVFLTLVAFTWRWAAAIVLAIASTLLVIVRCSAHLKTYPGASSEALRWGLLCCVWGTCTWSVVVLNALRYGIKSKITSVGLGLTGLLFIMAWLGPYPSVPSITVVSVSAYSAACVCSRALRADFCTIASSVISYAGVFFLLMHLINTSSRSPFWIGTQFFGYWVLSFIVEATVLAYTRQVFAASEVTR